MGTQTIALLPMSSDEITIRKAKLKDLYDVWCWWNDPLTRSMMAKKNYVPLLEHCRWYFHALKNKRQLLVIGCLGNKKMGIVRFDARDIAMQRWEVSINLNPAHRGLKKGSDFLVLAVNYFSKCTDYSSIYANVGEITNVASQKTFERAGFERTADPKYAFHYELSEKKPVVFYK